ncbi:MAG: hypothetical protein MI754_10300 [Chromatiales bacterium]|nr:hypothetical protein [Chromatiales bacterium]
MKYRSEIHPDKRIPSGKLAAQQKGVSVIAAIFLITGLAVLGALLTRLTATGNAIVINEWYSAQALYSAESGIDWSAYTILQGGAGTATNSSVLTDRAWFTTTVNSTSIGGKTLYIINSRGTAGTAVASPMVQRQVEVQFMP